MSLSTDPNDGPQTVQATVLLSLRDQHKDFAKGLVRRQLAEMLAGEMMSAATSEPEAGYGIRYEVRLHCFTTEQLTNFIRRHVERAVAGAPHGIYF